MLRKNFKDYPSPTGPYKVCLTNASPWKEYDKSRLHISVGSEKFEGDKFYALCEWAANRFDQIIIVLSDTAQRYNLLMQNKMSVNEAWIKSKYEGDLWLERNQTALDLLNSKTLYRWDDLIKHPDYLNTRLEIARIYNGRSSFFAAVNDTIETFLHRNATKANERNCWLYIMEELAAFHILFKEHSAINVYPGSPIEVAYNELAVEEPNTFTRSRWQQVDFIRNKAHSHWKTDQIAS